MPFLGSAHGAVSYGRARRGATWVNGGVVTTLAGNGSPAFADGTGTNATFRYPSDAALLSDGNIVVAASHDHRIRLVTYPGGVVTTLAGSGQSFANGTGTSANFNFPSGVAVIPSTGNIVVADQGNHRIRLVTYPGGVVTTLAGSGSQTFADGTGAGASFSNPNGVAVLPDGNLVVPDYGNHRIRLVNPTSGVVTTLAGSSQAFADGTGTNASFNNPVGVAITSTGNIVVADFGNHCIRHITYPGGVVTTIAGVGGSPGFANGTGTVARFADPIRVAMTPTDVIVVSDRGNARVRLVTYPGGVVTTLAGGGAGSADGTGTAAGFNSPTGLFILPSGIIVLVEQDGCRVRLIT